MTWCTIFTRPDTGGIPYLVAKSQAPAPAGKVQTCRNFGLASLISENPWRAITKPFLYTLGKKPLKSFSKMRTRKTEHPEVRQSPDGKPVTTSLDPPAAAQQQT